jgi:hypothetical protein
MALSYSLRLICLVIASAGILQISVELLLWIAAPSLLRQLQSLPIRSRERTIFLLQVSPFPLSLLTAVLFCVPQYLRTESNFASEEVGWAFLLLTFATTTWFGLSALRGLQAVLRTMHFARACRRAGQLHHAAGRTTPVLTLNENTQPVALVGLLNPFILVSSSLLENRTLTPEALELVLSHERSHAAHFDNWKLFTLYLLPRLNLRLRQGDTWMQLWQRTAEWAADEEAIGNDSERALLLAEALVAVVRSAHSYSTLPNTLIQAAFSCEEKDLITRVDRLIDQQPAQRPSRSPAQQRSVLLTLSMTVLGLSAMLLGLAYSMPALHRFSESLLHLG